MKKIVKLFLFNLLISFSIFAQDASINTIINAFHTGDLTVLSPILGSNVNLLLLEEESKFPKDKLIQAVNTFLAANPAKGMSLKHNGASEGGNKFLLGRFQSGDHQYRTYLVFKNELITEICIEED